MKIALIGASGRVGHAILAEALERGHTVTAIARNAARLTARPHLKTVDADVADPAQTAAAVKGNDAVIGAFNSGWTNPNIRADFAKGMEGIIAGVKQAGVKRILFLGGAGSLTEKGARLVDHPSFNPAYKEGALGAADALDRVRKEKDLDWSFISPAQMINPGERSGKYRHGHDEPVRDEKGESTISMGDLAHAILDEIEKPKHIRHRFTVGY
jgi:putative NADH-flavin reductase